MTGRVLRGLGAGALIAALWLGTIAGPVSAASSVRWVNDGGSGGPAACATAPYSSIQDAIDASSAWDSVYVCPGTYAEQIVINKTGLLVKSKPRHAAHIVAPDTLTDYDGEYALVVLESWAARLVGFDIGIASGDAPFSGAVAPQDVVCQHVDAAVWAVNGRARVNRNVIHPIGPNSLSGECGYDYGIVFGVAEPHVSASSGTILTGPEVSRAAHNKIKDFRAGGILIEGPGTKVHADHNKIVFLHTDDPECNFPIAGASVSPAACLIPLSTGQQTQSMSRLLQGVNKLQPSQLNSAFYQAFGVGVEDGAAADIDLNNIHSGLSFGGPSNSVLLAGVWLIEADGTSRVRSNVVTNAIIGIASGFLVVGSSSSSVGATLTTPGAAISRNQAYGNFAGIVVGDDENHVLKNITTANLYVGIDVYGEDNVIHGNNAAFNLIGYDCQDETAPDLPDILNTWYNNLGNYNTPDGLCTSVLPPD